MHKGIKNISIVWARGKAEAKFHGDCGFRISDFGLWISDCGWNYFPLTNITQNPVEGNYFLFSINYLLFSINYSPFSPKALSKETIFYFPLTINYFLLTNSLTHSTNQVKRCLNFLLIKVYPISTHHDFRYNLK